jgi:hypothetical protein
MSIKKDTKKDTSLFISFSRYCLASTLPSGDMGRVNFDNQDYHTSRTLVLLLHSEEFRASLVYQL